MAESLRSKDNGGYVIAESLRSNDNWVQMIAENLRRAVKSRQKRKTVSPNEVSK